MLKQYRMTYEVTRLGYSADFYVERRFRFQTSARGIYDRIIGTGTGVFFSEYFLFAVSALFQKCPIDSYHQRCITV